MYACARAHAGHRRRKKPLAQRHAFVKCSIFPFSNAMRSVLTRAPILVIFAHHMRAAAASRERFAHILLVDDNHHGLVARKVVLEELGYKISIARSGEEALAVYTAQPVDVVVTDFKMPKMDGIELIRQIRASDAAARIILLSGFVEPLGLSEATTGADIVISKSSGEVGNLVRSVTRLLSRKVVKKPPSSQKGSARQKARRN